MHPNLTLPNPFRPKQKRQGTRGSKWGTCRKAWSDLGPRWGETAKKWGQHEFWVNYNISLNWIKAIWGWFPLTMIPLRSQWGRYKWSRLYVYTMVKNVVNNNMVDDIVNNMVKRMVTYMVDNMVIYDYTYIYIYICIYVCVHTYRYDCICNDNM